MRKSKRVKRCQYEPLEQRTLLADAADIVWTNRDTTTSGPGGRGEIDIDHFGATFGTLAPIARSVVDAVLVRFEQLLGSFNYSVPSTVYVITVSMSPAGSGFGGNSFLFTEQNGKPQQGIVNLGAGNNDGISNNDNGWFIDSTPNENGEFTGNILNAFAGEAQSGSLAFNKKDFYTVVAHHVAHVLGIGLNELTGWSNRVANTGVADTASGVGNLWAFQGPSIKHLMTSRNDAGADAGFGVNTALLNSTASFGGDNYIAAADVSNAIIPDGRRCLPSNVISLMLRDAFGYTGNDAAMFGTFYAIGDTSQNLLIRGGDWGGVTSNDTISIVRSGGPNHDVTIDIGSDVPGTGALPGAGNLPAFFASFAGLHHYFVQPGSGNDTVNVDGTHGTVFDMTINCGAGNDQVNLSGNDRDLSKFSTPISVTGDGGSDGVFLGDNNNIGADTYTITSTTVTRTNFDGLTYSDLDSIALTAESGSNIFNVTSTAAGTFVQINGSFGNDVFNITPSALGGGMNLSGDLDTDTLNYNDLATTANNTYGISNTILSRVGGQSVGYIQMESVAVSGGSGTNTFNLSMGSGNAPATINGNSGIDTFNINTNGYSVAAAQNPVAINGGTSADVINFNTQSGAVTFDIFAASFTGTRLPNYTHSGIEQLNVKGGTGAETFMFWETSAATATYLDGGAGLEVVDVNSDGAGNATVRFNTTQDFASLNIRAGGLAVMEQAGNRVIETDALIIASTGKLDLVDNDLIVDYATATEYNNVRSLIAQARNGGLWNGTTGITSSAAASANPKNTTLGLMEAGDFKVIYGAAATFAGRAIDNTAVLVKYTYYGDCDFNGKVDGGDYARVDSAFNTETSQHTNIGGWINGDLDNDGKVDGADYSLIDAAFNSQAGLL